MKEATHYVVHPHRISEIVANLVSRSEAQATGHKNKFSLRISGISVIPARPVRRAWQKLSKFLRTNRQALHRSAEIKTDK